jgi:hypothetical protein
MWSDENPSHSSSSKRRAWADRPAAVTLGADRGYDAADFVNELRTKNFFHEPLAVARPRQKAMGIAPARF